MRFAAMSLYLIERRHRMAVAGGPLPLAPEAVDVACPGCGALFIGECLTEELPHDLESCRGQALRRLGEECPRHPRIFVVGVLQSA
jgi:hypothetical protein